MKKLMIAATCATAVVMGAGVAHADDPTTDPKPGPQAGSPMCNVQGGDDGTKWGWAPCGWAYGEEKGWYQVP